MNAIDWLLDLDTLRLGAEGVRFGFERPLPDWAWALVVVVALALGFWSYSRMTGPGWARGALAALRALLLVALVALVSGPRLVERGETIERDWVLALVDRSASMTIEDAPGDADGARVSRESSLRAALALSSGMWAGLAEEREVVWLGVASGAFDLSGEAPPGGGAAATPALGEPDGSATEIGRALDEALGRAAARPVSAVVVLSDGRSSDEASRAALRRLRSDRVPVHAVALGSERPVGDVSVRLAEAPRSAFVGDVTPVRVGLDWVGAEPGAGATVRLVDAVTGEELASRRVESPADGSERSETTLSHRTSEAGEASWAVVVESDGPDLIAGNNRAEMDVELVDRPLRVLYVDGYPRWEQRYLRNLLLRESSVTSSSIMLGPDRRYTQEGNVEIDAIPDSAERWSEYDVVILGDVSPEMFTAAQLEGLLEHVAERGAGLVWIGGEGQTPMSWWDTPLAETLPFATSGFDGSRVEEAFVVEPTPGAERVGVLRLSGDPESPWPAALSDPDAGWSSMRWGQRIEASGLKPTAETLATGRTVFSGELVPVVLSMRYGAGRSLYVATDETWRWRYARGERYYERFWVPLIRMLGRDSLARGGRSALLEVSPARATLDEPVRVSVTLLDQSLLDAGLSSVTVRAVRRSPGADGPTVVEIELRPERDDASVFSATWSAPEPGEWTLEPLEGELSALRERLAVSLPDGEMRDPAADHGWLARLAEETGGRVFAPSALGELPAHLPNRRERLVNETSESLWDTPLALITVLSLLTLEWVGRRVIRLV